MAVNWNWSGKTLVKKKLNVDDYDQEWIYDLQTKQFVIMALFLKKEYTAVRTADLYTLFYQPLSAWETGTVNSFSPTHYFPNFGGII